MKLHKDRYTHAILAAMALIILALYFFRQGKKDKLIALGLSASSFLSVSYLLSLMFCSYGRVHYDREQDIESFQFKGEKDCGFSSIPKKKVDGIKTPDGKRYKVVNGADVYIKQGKIKPCGPGSAFMQCIGKGGYEPDTIQKDNCWI